MSTPPPPMPPSSPSLQPPPIAPPSFSFGGYMGTPGGIEGVGFWPRAGARLIDLVVHFIATTCAGFVFGMALVLYAGATGQSVQFLIAKAGGTTFSNYVFALLGFVAYSATCESIHGSTLGKWALSMVVVEEDGSPCRFGAAVVRSFAYYVDALFFGLVGYFAMQKTPQEQRYGDQWAHTIVCKRSNVAPPNLRGGGRFALALILGMIADGALAVAGIMFNLVF